MAKANLQALLGEEPEEKTETKEADPVVRTEVTMHAEPDICARIAGVEIEAVVGGALQRIQFVAGTNPAEVKAMLLSLDPNTKVRDDFPKRGSFGNRETKAARCLVINARVTDTGKFVDLVCQNGDDLSVAVSKKNSETFLQDLTALQKLHDRNLKKLAKAFDEKGTATVILGDDEQFGVNYWTTDDGKAFMDSMATEPPAPKGDDDGKEKGDE